MKIWITMFLTVTALVISINLFATNSPIDISGNWKAAFTYGDTGSAGFVWISPLQPNGNHQFKFTGSHNGAATTGTFDDAILAVTFIQTGTPNRFTGTVDRTGRVIKGAFHQTVPDLANFGEVLTR